MLDENIAHEGAQSGARRALWLRESSSLPRANLRDLTLSPWVRWLGNASEARPLGAKILSVRSLSPLRAG